MSQLSFPSFDSCLLVRDAHGRYLPASADDILEAARQVIDRKMRRGAEFTSPAAVKEYLRTKLASFEHEVFVVLFMDTRHRLIEYRRCSTALLTVRRCIRAKWSRRRCGSMRRRRGALCGAEHNVSYVPCFLMFPVVPIWAYFKHF